MLALDFLIRLGASADRVFGSIGRDYDAAAQLAVDLHRNLNLIFFGQGGIVLRPRRAQQNSLFAQHFP